MLRRNLADARWYMEKLLKIRTKDQRLIPLTLNLPQRKLHAAVERQRRLGRPVRIICLKARQLGISTYIEARHFHQAATNRYMSGLVIAHEIDASDNLFQMAKRFYEHLPEEVQLSDGSAIQIKPETKYSNRKELVFADLDSKIAVDTANNEDAARSGTIQFFHGSEVAFWSDAKKVMTAVHQAMPRHPLTMMFLESTANGVGGYFYDEWQRAKAGESDFEPVFIAWWEMPEYRLPVTEPLIYDDEELHLKELYGLDDEQLMWRREMIRTECHGDVEIFRQEYPSNDHEAFLVSGRPFFSRQSLTLYAKQVRPPRWKGYLREHDDGTIELVEDPSGYLWVWEKPQEGQHYAVGADVAEGLAHGDKSAAQVINRTTFEQVAEWHGSIDPDVFGEELYKLGKWYNWAYMGVEVNNHGLTTNKRLEARGYPYLYYRQQLDTASERQTDRIGWQTSSKTRPIMLDTLSEAIRELYLLVNSARFVDEALRFVRNDKGKPEAQPGYTDDLVMAMAIAIQMHELMPMPRSKSEDRQPPRRRVLSKAAGY